MLKLKMIATSAIAAMAVTGARAPAAPFSGHKYNKGVDATSGKNNNTFFYDRAGIKAATEENEFSMLANSRTMKRGTGKEYRVSMWLHILDDRNNTNQGLGRDGSVTTGVKAFIVGSFAFLTQAEADAKVLELNEGRALQRAAGDGVNPVDVAVVAVTAGNNNGNMYGSSRDIGNVSAKMPLLAEGEGRVNRVGVSKITFSTNLVRYGNFLEYTDEDEIFSEDNVQVHYHEELGYAAGQVYDDLVQMDLLNGCGVTLYAGSGNLKIADIAAGDIVSFDDIRMATKTLTKNLAKKHTSIISGSTKVDTLTVNASYFAYIGIDTRYVLESVKDGTEKAWTPARKYASAGNLAKNEAGAIHETRFIESTRMLMYAKGTAGATVDVAPILYIGKDSFSTLGLQGKSKINFKSKAPGPITEFDPYGVKGMFSYNFFYGSIVTRPENLIKILTALK